MTHRRELRAYDYVNRPLAAVRMALLADPLTVFRRATSTGAADAVEHGPSELRVRVGAIELASDISIELVSIEEGRSPLDQTATNVTLTWKSSKHPGWFPQLRGVLAIYALSPTETQLDFAGTYEPPMGLFGNALDAIALHRVAETSVKGFIGEIAKFLRVGVHADAVAAS